MKIHFLLVRQWSFYIFNPLHCFTFFLFRWTRVEKKKIKFLITIFIREISLLKDLFKINITVFKIIWVDEDIWAWCTFIFTYWYIVEIYVYQAIIFSVSWAFHLFFLCYKRWIFWLTHIYVKLLWPKTYSLFYIFFIGNFFMFFPAYKRIW